MMHGGNIKLKPGVLYGVKKERTYVETTPVHPSVRNLVSATKLPVELL